MITLIPTKTYNYYFLAHLKCSLNFACNFIPWYLLYVDNFTSKKYAKTINLLCAGIKVLKCLQNIELNGFFQPQHQPTLAYALETNTSYALLYPFNIEF